MPSRAADVPGFTTPIPAPAPAPAPNPYQAPAGQPPYGTPQPTYPPQQAAYGVPTPGYAPAPAGNDIADEAKGFFAKLFDLSLKTYITPSIVRVLYVITMVISVIVWLVIIIAAFHGSVALGIVAIILGWIVGLLVLIGFRLTFEVTLAIIRIAENTARIK